MVGHRVLVPAVGVRLPAPQQWLKIIKRRCIDTKDTLKIFSGRSNLALAQGIVDVLGMDLGDVTIRTFADGELWVKYEENIRGQDVFIIQSTNEPADN